MGTYKIPIDNLDQTEAFQQPNCPPVRRLATPGLDTNLGLFWIYFTIIGPQLEKPEDHVTLSNSEAENILEAISDTIVFLNEELRRKDTARS